jgi:hypothetical protein
MSEYSLDGLVSQFAVVWTSMTESEALLLDRVRQVRLDAQNSSAVAGAPHPSMPSAADPATVRSAPAPTPSEAAPTSVDNGGTARDGESAPAWASTPSPVGPPEFPHTEAGTPAAGRRNYDYFSELDEKLTGLRQRYLE